MSFKKRGSARDRNIWEQASEKQTEEVIAVLCINSGKAKDYQGEENVFVLNQKN